MPHSPVGLITAARREFPAFYAMAPAWDASLLDWLVLAHAAVVVGFNTPREHVAPVVRGQLEKTTDAAERVFTDLRERVRTCATFVALTPGEQLAIRRVLFDVGPAWIRTAP